jgi:nitroreductase
MRTTDIDVFEHRRPEHEVDDLFVRRWSPRALSGEEISEAELLSLFEAARWAPSSYNGQPWRFLYARRGTPAWQTFHDLMVEFNQSWAGEAAALVVIVSRDTFEHNGKPARTHSFDAGAAWMSLALQATLSGLVAHGMQGFDYDRAKEVLGVPDGYQVEAMVAIGRPGERDDLPEKMRETEQPNSRKSVSEIAFEGGFPRENG